MSTFSLSKLVEESTPTRQFTDEETLILDTPVNESARFRQWTDEETKLIVKWLSLKDGKGVFKNFMAYQNGNREAETRRLLHEVFLLNSKSDITVDQVQPYIADLVEVYTRLREKANNSTWDVNPAGHAETAHREQNSPEISETMLSECPYFYELDRIMAGDLKVPRTSLRLQLKAIERLSKNDRSIATPAAIPPRKNPIDSEEVTAGRFLEASLPKNRQKPFLGGPQFQTVPASSCWKSLPNTSFGDKLAISNNENTAKTPNGWSVTPTAAGHTQELRAPHDAPFAAERVTDFAPKNQLGFTTESNTPSMIDDAHLLSMPLSGRVAPRGGSSTSAENRPHATHTPYGNNQPQLYAQRELPALGMTSSGSISSAHGYNQPQPYAHRELPALNSIWNGPISAAHNYNQPQPYAPRELPALNTILNGSISSGASYGLGGAGFPSSRICRPTVPPPGAAVVPQSSKSAMTPLRVYGHASTSDYQQLRLLDTAVPSNPGTYASSASIDNPMAIKRSRTSHLHEEGGSATCKNMDDKTLNEIVDEVVKRKVAEAIAKERRDMDEKSISIAVMLQQHHGRLTEGPINHLEGQMARNQDAMMKIMNETLVKQDRVIQKLGDFADAVGQQNGQRRIEDLCAETVCIIKSQQETMERVLKSAGEKIDEYEAAQESTT